MQIVNMKHCTINQRQQAAQILKESLRNGWPTIQDAEREIKERLIPENTLLSAVEHEKVLGWGGILAPEYSGNVFELHPLVVKKDQRMKGIGRALIIALEEEARKQGGLTMYLGSDDDTGATSLANNDLCQDLGNQLKDFKAGTHSSGFYLKIGYQIIGVMPDANGRGKPVIFLGKSL